MPLDFLSSQLATFAYIGPGGGLSAIGALIALIAVIVLAFVGFVWYPIKRLRRRLKHRESQPANTTAQPSPSQHPAPSHNK